MGTWGAGILDDDFARDVYDIYMDAVRSGRTPREAVAAVQARFAREMADPDENAVAWLALARAQREAGAVDALVVARVQAIVDGGQGLVRWREAGPDSLRQRKAALTRFVRQLSTAAPKARRPAAATVAAPFDVGDCVAIDCADGRVEGAVVTRHKVTGSTRSHVLTVVNVPDVAPLAPQHFAPPRWRPVHPDHPGLAVKIEVYDDGWARHAKRYRLVGRIDPGEVPQPLGLKPATWANLWKIFPR